MNPFVSTGIPDLDHVLGGGWPRGRFVELFGRASSGKTSFAYEQLAYQQRTSCVALVDAAGHFDAPYARSLGVDLSQLLIAIPTFGEEAVEATHDFIASGVDFLVVDSLFGFTPLAAVRTSLLEPTDGMQARLLAQGLRKLSRVAIDHGAVVLVLNQVSEVDEADMEASYGGAALATYASTRCRLLREGAATSLELIRTSFGQPGQVVCLDGLWHKNSVG